MNPLHLRLFKGRIYDPPGSNKERSGTKVVKEGIEHCTECNKDGHKREGCFKLVGYPEWWPGKKGEKTKGNAACVETQTSPIPGEWIFDSGCTEYINYLSNILVNKKATHFEAPVVIPNRDSIPVKGKGDYVLLGGTKVNGVLYVPEFKCKLLFGLQKRNLIGAGRCRGGLYRMKMIQEERPWLPPLRRGTEE
ncbi:hypothetical protein Tco_0230860 [Tanacetum coccineum]